MTVGLVLLYDGNLEKKREYGKAYSPLVHMDVATLRTGN